jgi:three-Cys-motif partner protein
VGKPLPTIWPLEPHTAKKHEILRRYFEAWLPILAQRNPRLLYIDAFAGPGEYSEGEPGSPLVILKAARDHGYKFKSELQCLFVESDNERHKHLVELLEGIKPTLPTNIKFRALHGTFASHATDIFARVKAQREFNAPTLAFLDPFGFSQIQFRTVANLLKSPKSEVLVNVMYEEMNRFLSDDRLAACFDSQFGTTEWRQILEMSDPVERLMGIHDLYLKQLRTVAKYVRAFLMRNKSNTPDYFLFFATNSLKGLEEMKKSMWKVNPEGEFQFSDFVTAKKQLPLFKAEPDHAWLRELIVEQFERKRVEIGVLCDWVVAETPYLRTHVKTPILIPMEKEGALTVVEAKPGRRVYTYPDGTVLRFS